MRPLRLGKGVDLIGEEEIAAVTACLRDQSLFRYHSDRTPSRVADFEAAICDSFGARFALATSSGTAALRCALAALGVGPGHEVIVPAFTFIATVSAVVAAGARPVFAEVDDTLTLEPGDVAAKVTDRTRAVVPVHLENVACDMDALTAAAGAVPILEDAAQAIGVTYRGRAVGTIGAIGAFSLQQTKNITTGEGGIVTTDDDELYVRAARYHDQGGQFVTQYRGSRGPDVYGSLAAPSVAPLRPHGVGLPFMGDNLRMTEIAGAIGLVQLGRLPGLLAAMRVNAARVAAEVGEIDGLVPRRIPDAEGAGGSSLTWFAPDAAAARRLVDELRAERVPAAQMYDGRAVYTNEAVQTRRTATGEFPETAFECPRAEDLAARSVTVGIGPAFTAADCGAVGAAVQKIARRVL